MRLKKREDRRDRTWRAGRRAQIQHMWRVHPDGVVDCVCERSVWFFDKGGKMHGCRGREHGNPKYGRGPCRHGRRKAVDLRIAGNRLARAWLRAYRSGAPDDDDEL